MSDEDAKSYPVVEVTSHDIRPVIKQFAKNIVDNGEGNTRKIEGEEKRTQNESDVLYYMEDFDPTPNAAEPYIATVVSGAPGWCGKIEARAARPTWLGAEIRYQFAKALMKAHLARDWEQAKNRGARLSLVCMGGGKA